MAGAVYVTEYAGMGTTGVGWAMPQEPALAEQVVNTTASSAQSAAFNTNTRFVRVHAATIVSIKFGPNPTAVTTAHRMAAGTTEYFAVKSGDKLAAIDNT